MVYNKELNATLKEINPQNYQLWETDSPEEHLKNMWLNPKPNIPVGTKAILKYYVTKSYGLWRIKEIIKEETERH